MGLDAGYSFYHLVTSRSLSFAVRHTSWHTLVVAIAKVDLASCPQKGLSFNQL